LRQRADDFPEAIAAERLGPQADFRNSEAGAAELAITHRTILSAEAALRKSDLRFDNRRGLAQREALRAGGKLRSESRTALGATRSN
jgi:hypothetical protein